MQTKSEKQIFLHRWLPPVCRAFNRCGERENIENAAILIHCTPQILQAPTDLDKHFVEILGVTEFSTPSADAFDVVSAESLTPCSNRLVGCGDAALGHHFVNVAIADGEPKVQPHARADDFWRKAITTVCRGERVHGAIESEPATTGQCLPILLLATATAAVVGAAAGTVGV